MKNIAVIGSSGGNLFNLGGAEPQKLLQEIYTQCQSVDLNVVAVQFIAATKSMDSIKLNTPASLYCLDDNASPNINSHGSLLEINEIAKNSDYEIAQLIAQNKIDGLIIMSADPDGCNKEVIEAAVKKQIPIVGTGGTSMSLITAKGAKIVAVSGTTGTTNRTRAIAFVAALCKYWQIKYMPILGRQHDETLTQSQQSLRSRINIRSFMLPALPGFIAMAIVLALSKVPGWSELYLVFEALLKCLPIIIATIAVKKISELDEVALVAGIVVGALSIDGGIIGGIIGGIGTGVLLRYLFNLCLRWRFPMTTVNIVAGGLAGLIVGLIMYYLLNPMALLVGDSIKSVIEATLAFSPILAGLIAGLVIWPAILSGVYHAVILPLVLLEMEKNGMSFLGAVDMIGLVMVAAGINLANVILPKERSEMAVAAPGLIINLGFGTFVESAYPFMFANKFVFTGAILTSGIGGMLLGLLNVKGTAYVPAIFSPFLSNEPFYMAMVMVFALVFSCMITLLANGLASRKLKRHLVS